VPDALNVRRQGQIRTAAQNHEPLPYTRVPRLVNCGLIDQAKGELASVINPTRGALSSPDCVVATEHWSHSTFLSTSCMERVTREASFGDSVYATTAAIPEVLSGLETVVREASRRAGVDRRPVGHCVR
jgi:hypothetical protein